MNRTELLKKMLPGLLPLLVFIIVDEIAGTKEGIIFALIFGILELVFIYIKEKRIDKFVIVDTLLLVAFGGFSLLLENDIFFKLKPALIELIFCFLIGFSAFSKKNLIMSMSKRYMKGVEMNHQVELKFKSSLKVMFWMFFVHTLLIVYSAYFMSNAAWGFISSALLYILFAVYFLYEFISNKLKINKLNKEEQLPIVDKEGEIIGQAPRSACHKDKSLLHPVVHVHFFNEKGEFFLQKRAKNKLIQPDKWDTSVGGHVSVGETIEQALEKEVGEELGVKIAEYQFVKSYVWESEVERELVYVFLGKTNEQIKIDKKELSDGKYWTINEIKKNIRKNIFTPNFESEFNNIVLPML